MVYPSPYRTGMSSLGFLQIYRIIQDDCEWSCERAFLPDDVGNPFLESGHLLSYETESPLRDFDVLAFSVAYEMEIAGVLQCLKLAGIEPLCEQRSAKDPFILMGVPLTFSNPLPLAPFADTVLMGECDESIVVALRALEHDDKKVMCRRLADAIPSAFVPSLHGAEMPEIAKVELETLPAYAAIRTSETELSNMFLMEAERGCSRGCKYCVMRRSTNGGMRIVPMEKLLSLVPENATRVGLVGAAVSDHPHIVDVVEALADSGKEVGLSSLRPDRLNERFVRALKRAGYRTLTTASDGASQRLRDMVQRKAQERHIFRAAELVREVGMERLKLYMMVGLPSEEDADIDELIEFTLSLARIAKLSLGIAPFVAKRNTPLDGEPFAGIKTVDRRLDKLRLGVRGKVEIRPTSARWAWIEWVLAQGGYAEGLAVLEATKHGARFSDYRKAFEAIPKTQARRALRVVA